MVEVKQFETEQSESNSSTPQARARYSHPYFDMDTSLLVAKKVHEVGGGSCTSDQLAAYLEYKSVKSGTFQTRVSAARQFGFIQYASGNVVVTDRAHKILSPVLPEDATTAREDAFLAVKLFNAIYGRHQGSTLPPEVGLKNLMVQTFGLSKDRSGPAVRILLDSAEQAGFFRASGDRSRLIKPAVKPSGQTPKSDPPKGEQPPPPHDERRKSSGGGEDPPGVHSAIIGLLRELPIPGSAWSSSKKASFKKAFEATLDFIYPTENEAGSAKSEKA